MSAPSLLDRRLFLGLALFAGAAAAPVLSWAADIPARPFIAVPIAHPIAKTSRPMKIGVIGSGNIGGTLGEIWWKAGHQLMFSDRDPAAAKAQADRMAGSRTGTVEQAIAFADVVLIGAPFGAWPDVARQYGPALRGKIVLDPTNPNATRDGDLVPQAQAKGTGPLVAGLVPGAKLVRAFNTSNYANFAKEAGRPGAKMAIPVAANDPAAMAAGLRLVTDAGFDAIEVGGGIEGSRKFELAGPANGVKTAAEMRAILGL